MTTGEVALSGKTDLLEPKLPPQGWEDDFFGSCPIVEDKPSPNKEEVSAQDDQP